MLAAFLLDFSSVFICAARAHAHPYTAVAQCPSHADFSWKARIIIHLTLFCYVFLFLANFFHHHDPKAFVLERPFSELTHRPVARPDPGIERLTRARSR